MANEVFLAYLAAPRTGGWVSFTAHLAHGLRQAGHRPVVLRLGKRTESRTRDFGMGLEYTNTSLATMDLLARQQPFIVTAVSPKVIEPEALMGLRACGAGLVIHDPTELKPDVQAALVGDTGPLWVIRPTMLDYLPGAQLIPHPYARAGLGRWAGRKLRAVAYSRLDWDKHTDMIVEANRIVQEQDRVRIHGTENRMYTHHKLDSIDPDWRTQYDGPMPRTDLWAGARLALRSDLAVDLSAIKGDGGGTQYTFLEALDAGSRLVINRRWLTGHPDQDTIGRYVHAVVNSAQELAAVLADRSPVPPPDADALLQQHDAARVARSMLEAL